MVLRLSTDPCFPPERPTVVVSIDLVIASSTSAPHHRLDPRLLRPRHPHRPLPPRRAAEGKTKREAKRYLNESSLDYSSDTCSHLTEPSCRSTSLDGTLQRQRPERRRRNFSHDNDNQPFGHHAPSCW